MYQTVTIVTDCECVPQRELRASWVLQVQLPPALAAAVPLQHRSQFANSKAVQGGCSTSDPSIWESSRTWPSCLGPVTHGGDQDEIPGSWFQSGPVLTVIATWGVNQQMKHFK